MLQNLEQVAVSSACTEHTHSSNHMGTRRIKKGRKGDPS